LILQCGKCILSYEGKVEREENDMVGFQQDKCIRCGRCIADCVVKVLRRDEKGFPFMPENLEKFCIGCQHCLAVCPAEAVDCNGKTAADCQPLSSLPQPEEVAALMRQRRSIRHYEPCGLPPEIIGKLKESLAWSATGCNDRSMVFKIVENSEDMQFFRQESSRMLRKLLRFGILQLLYPGVKRFLQDICNGEDVIFREAPHMIVCAVSDKAPCKEADPYIALSNFDIYAQTLGVGTCWCGFAVYAFKFNRKMRKKLNIPKGYKISSAMLFGKAAVEYQRATAPENFNFME